MTLLMVGGIGSNPCYLTFQRNEEKGFWKLPIETIMITSEFRASEKWNWEVESVIFFSPTQVHSKWPLCFFCKCNERAYNRTTSWFQREAILLMISYHIISYHMVLTGNYHILRGLMVRIWSWWNTPCERDIVGIIPDICHFFSTDTIFG